MFPPTLRTLFTYQERKPFYDRQKWFESGMGVRFARLEHLGLLPPGEPVKVEMLFLNTGPSTVAATCFITIAHPQMPPLAFSGEVPDLPPGHVFDVMHPIPLALPPGDYSLTLACQPHPPIGGMAAPLPSLSGRVPPPPLAPRTGDIPPGLPHLPGVLKIRPSPLACPTCRGAFMWKPKVVGHELYRGWVCAHCGYRLSAGTV